MSDGKDKNQRVKKKKGGGWWCRTPLISALGGQKQADI